VKKIVVLTLLLFTTPLYVTAMPKNQLRDIIAKGLQKGKQKTAAHANQQQQARQRQAAAEKAKKQREKAMSK